MVRTGNGRIAVVATIAVAVTSGLFVAFVYAYPRLFPRIEASAPSHCDIRVAEILAKGDLDRALKVAHKATKFIPLDPMTHTVYGNVLLVAGDEERGLASLNHALQIRQSATVGDTRKPFYYAPARRRLGQYYFAWGQLTKAIGNFELARGYNVPTADTSADYRDDLYIGYAAHGFWHRALEFGEPSDRQILDLGSETLLEIGQVSMRNGHWGLAQKTAETLLARAQFTTESTFIAGRVALNSQEYEQSIVHLKQALADGHADAAYFLGQALHTLGRDMEAVEAFSATPAESVYYVFACGRALTLLRNATPESSAGHEARQQELESKIDSALARMRSFGSPVIFDRYLELHPAAVTLPDQSYHGGPIPVMILWQTADGSPDEKDQPLVSESDTDGNLQISIGSHVAITLQWVQNGVNWTSMEDTRVEELPGWIDTARDWFQLRTDYVPYIDRGDPSDPFLVIPKVTWFYSVPIKVNIHAGYILAGRINAPSGKGSIGWQALDDNELVMASGEFLQQSPPGEWTAKTGYIRPLPHWNEIRVQLNVLPGSGKVAFDDVMMLEVREPTLVGVE